MFSNGEVKIYADAGQVEQPQMWQQNVGASGVDQYTFENDDLREMTTFRWIFVTSMDRRRTLTMIHCCFGYTGGNYSRAALSVYNEQTTRGTVGAPNVTLQIYGSEDEKTAELLHTYSELDIAINETVFYAEWNAILLIQRQRYYSLPKHGLTFIARYNTTNLPDIDSDVLRSKNVIIITYVVK